MATSPKKPAVAQISARTMICYVNEVYLPKTDTSLMLDSERSFLGKVMIRQCGDGSTLSWRTERTGWVSGKHERKLLQRNACELILRPKNVIYGS